MNATTPYAHAVPHSAPAPSSERSTTNSSLRSKAPTTTQAAEAPSQALAGSKALAQRPPADGGGSSTSTGARVTDATTLNNVPRSTIDRVLTEQQNLLNKLHATKSPSDRTRLLATYLDSHDHWIGPGPAFRLYGIDHARGNEIRRTGTGTEADGSTTSYNRSLSVDATGGVSSHDTITTTPTKQPTGAGLVTSKIETTQSFDAAGKLTKSNATDSRTTKDDKGVTWKTTVETEAGADNTPTRLHEHITGEGNGTSIERDRDLKFTRGRPASERIEMQGSRDKSSTHQVTDRTFNSAGRVTKEHATQESTLVESIKDGDHQGTRTQHVTSDITRDGHGSSVEGVTPQHKETRKTTLKFPGAGLESDGDKVVTVSWKGAGPQNKIAWEDASFEEKLTGNGDDFVSTTAKLKVDKNGGLTQETVGDPKVNKSRDGWIDALDWFRDWGGVIAGVAGLIAFGAAEVLSAGVATPAVVPAAAAAAGWIAAGVGTASAALTTYDYTQGDASLVDVGFSWASVMPWAKIAPKAAGVLSAEGSLGSQIAADAKLWGRLTDAYFDTTSITRSPGVS